jgi:carbon monoxide dehydrogenase subunit G
MPRISRSTQVAASPEDVIEYIADVDHHPAFISALRTVENLSANPREPEAQWSWSFTFAGVDLQGQARMVEYLPGRRYSFRTSGGADSTFVYEADAQDGGTRLTASCDFEMPPSVLTAVVDSNAITRFTEGVADDAIQNLKAIFEA